MTTKFTKTPEGTILYQIHVSDKQESDSNSDTSDVHIVNKTYDQFCDLHKRLQERIPGRVLPELPPSGFSLFSPTKFYEKRAASLQAYMDSLCTLEPARTCPDFLDFAGTHKGEQNRNQSRDGNGEWRESALESAGVGLIEVPAVPHEKVGALKRLSVSGAVGRANKTLIEFNALYTRLANAQGPRGVLAIIDTPSAEDELAAKACVLENSRKEVDAVLAASNNNDSVHGSNSSSSSSSSIESDGAALSDPDVRGYLEAVSKAIAAGTGFIGGVDVLRSLALVERAEAAEAAVQKKRPNAKIADEYLPWYIAQSDRLVPLLFAEDMETSSVASESLRTLETAMAKDAQRSREVGDDATAARLESVRAEVARAVQAQTDGGDGNSSSSSSGRGLAFGGTVKGEAYFAQKAGEYEAAMFALISQADGASGGDDNDDTGRRRSGGEWRGKILEMMRDLRQLRTDIKKAMENVEKEAGLSEDERLRRMCGLRRVGERVEELQQNIGDFEEAWSRTVETKPTWESRQRDAQVASVQKATLALEDELYEL